MLARDIPAPPLAPSGDDTLDLATHARRETVLWQPAPPVEQEGDEDYRRAARSFLLGALFLPPAFGIGLIAMIRLFGL